MIAILDLQSGSRVRSMLSSIIFFLFLCGIPTHEILFPLFSISLSSSLIYSLKFPYKFVQKFVFTVIVNFIKLNTDINHHKWDGLLWHDVQLFTDLCTPQKCQTSVYHIIRNSEILGFELLTESNSVLSYNYASIRDEKNMN